MSPLFVVQFLLALREGVERPLTARCKDIWVLRNARLLLNDVIELLKQIAKDHGAPQADAVLATVRSIMVWHQIRDKYYVLPIVKGMKRDKRDVRERKRERFLRDNEIRALWDVATGVSGTSGALFKMLLLISGSTVRILAHPPALSLWKNCQRPFSSSMRLT